METVEKIAVKSTESGVSFPVRLIPGSRVDKIVGPYDGALKVKVSAPPERGRANKALIQLLSRRLSLPKGSVWIVSGEFSEHKLIEVSGISAETLLERFGQAREPRELPMPANSADRAEE